MVVLARLRGLLFLHLVLRFPTTFNLGVAYSSTLFHFNIPLELKNIYCGVYEKSLFVDFIIKSKFIFMCTNNNKKHI